MIEDSADPNGMPMKKPNKKRAAKPRKRTRTKRKAKAHVPAHRFGKLRVPRDAQVVDTGYVFSED